MIKMAQSEWLLIGQTIFFTGENLSYVRIDWLTFPCLHLFTG
jgi:hypothetical protein